VRFPGRTLVFVNSVTTLRSVSALLAALRVPVHTLHAHMQQRQRLQHLERFRADPHGVLVATDVAARGLDVPAVDFVVHHSLPQAAETFLHRCGRTARGASRGLALALVDPRDHRAYGRIMLALGVAKGLPEFPSAANGLVGFGAGGGARGDMRRLVARVALARRIAAEQALLARESQQQQWLVSEALGAGLDVDEEAARDAGIAGSADLALVLARHRDKEREKAAARLRRKRGRPAAGGGGEGGAGGEEEEGEGEDGEGSDEGAPAAPEVGEDERAEAAERAQARARGLKEMRRELGRMLAEERAERGGTGSGTGGGGGGGGGKAVAVAARRADGARLSGGGGAGRFATANPLLLGRGGRAQDLHPLQNMIRVEGEAEGLFAGPGGEDRKSVV
jgi:superfamily II DNA/RNA helicase